MWWRRNLLALCVLAVSDAGAATVTAIPTKASDTSLVIISGPFEPNDANVFKLKTASLPKSIVMLESDGGNLVAGLQIGEAIRLKGYVSFVAEGARCASACALAWLGGTKRLMGKGAQVGFHSAYDSSTGAVSGSGDALIGAYLNKIGLPERAIVYLTSAAPAEMQWLNIDDAKMLGVDVEAFSLPAKPTPRPRQHPVQLAAPVASVPDAPTTVPNRADINAACSQRADALGLHGIARRDFRERCKIEPLPAE